MRLNVTAPAGSFKTRVWVDGVLAGTWSSAGLGTGAHEDGWVNAQVHAPGTRRVGVMADVLESVPEADEGNNFVAEDWVWYARLHLPLVKR